MTAPVQPGDRWGMWIIEYREGHPRLRVRRPRASETPIICSLSAACDMAHRIAPVADIAGNMGILERQNLFAAARHAALTWDAGRQAVAS